MMAQFQVFSGHFHKAEYFEYITKEKKTVDNGVEFRFKQTETTQKDISTNKETTRTQDMTGRVYSKRSFSITTISTLPFKINDKIKLSSENKYYTVIGKSEGYDSVMALSALQFNDVQYPIILELE
jgi:hypothetical protein